MVWDPRHINLQEQAPANLMLQKCVSYHGIGLAQAAQRGVIAVHAVLCMAAPLVVYLEH